LEDNEDFKPEDSRGFGFVNFTILPHLGSENFRIEVVDTTNRKISSGSVVV